MGGFIRCKLMLYLIYLFHTFYSLASGLSFFHHECLEQETKARRGQVMWPASLAVFHGCAQCPRNDMGTWVESPFLWLSLGLYFCRHQQNLSKLGSSHSSFLGEAQQRVAMSPLGRACGYPPPRRAWQTAPLHAPKLPWPYCCPMQGPHAANQHKWRPGLSLCDHHNAGSLECKY